MKTIGFATITTLMMAGVANAGMYFEKNKDAFNDRVSISVMGESNEGSLLGFSIHEPTSKFEIGDVLFIMNAGKFICARGADRMVKVEWIGLDAAGERVGRGEAPMQVSKSSKFVGARPGAAFIPDLIDLFQKASEVRFRIDNDCGDRSTLTYSTTGMNEALTKFKLGSAAPDK